MIGSDGTLGPRKIVIRPGARWRGFGVRELWEYRELVLFLAWRDIKVRYKQTAIGVLWALLQPAAMMVVFTVFFGRLMRVSSMGVSYPLFVLSALLPWQLFSRSLSDATNSLVADQRLIARVYFPRIAIPLASTLAALLDFVIAAFLLMVGMVMYGVSPPTSIVFLPGFMLLLLITSLGVGLWLSALNIEYRDVAYVIPLLNQLWFFVTPVVYSSGVVPEAWRTVYALNPMVSVIDGFRWSLLGVGRVSPLGFLVSFVFAFAALISGSIWFQQRQRHFADAIGSGGR